MRRGLLAVVVGAALLAWSMPAGVTAAAPMVVTTVTDTVDANPGDGQCLDAANQCSLRAAIMEANARSGADTIIVPPGTYLLARGGRDENASATGDLDITDAVTIVGAGGNPDGDPSLTVIDGGGIDKVFSVNPSFTLAFATTIQALTIQNGNNTSSRVADGFGGGLDWEASGTGTLTIYNCVIQNNITQEGDGGGLALTNTPGSAAAQVTISKSIITNNRASAGIGGGIFIGTTTPFTITDSVVSNNQAFDGTTGVGAGAGIFVFGPAVAGAPSSISGSTISGNIAHGNGADGGGLYSTAALSVSGTTFSGNQSGRDGGGYYSSLEPGKAVTLTNVTFSGNTAAGKGGGFAQNVFNSGSPPTTVTMTNVTVTANRAGEGGGLHMRTGAGAMTLRNTLVAGNFLGATGTASDVGGPLDAGSAHNLFGTGGAGGLTNGTNGNQVGVANPRLGPLASNGGLTQTHALLVGSPALDAGSNALANGSTDQRGAPRQADAADADATATVDIGAYEAHPSIEDITDKTALAGVPLFVTFNVGDAALGIGAFAVTSSDPGLLSATEVTGTGSTRTLTLTAARAGAATITVTASGGMGSMSDTFLLTVQAPADLTVTKSHAGDFRQGQQGARYTVTVTNSGGQATDGTEVTLTEAPPTGLSVVSMSGTGWTCPAGGLTCTRSGALAAGASYPPVTVTVDVAADAPATVTNSVTVAGGGDAATGNNSASDPTTVAQVADLTVAKSHTGNFTPGQTGATFSITVTNAGAGPTVGTVTVTETLPAGLTLMDLSGTGWNCPAGGLTCTHSGALAAGGSYPPITATVDVAAGALGSLTNQVAVAGGGELNTGNNSASDTVAIDAFPDLTVAKSHTGDFRQGQQGATYTLTVQNTGFSDTAGAVTVTDTLPAGLSAVSLSGDGWTCDLPSLTCTRSDALAPGASYQAITLTVNVAADAAPALTNQVRVDGGGEMNTANNTAADPTTVILAADLTVALSHAGDFTQGQAAVVYTMTVTNSGAGPTTGTVTASASLPAGLTATAIDGTGWTCDLATLSCSRSDALAAGGAYPPVTITVSVAATAPPQLTSTAQVTGGGQLNTANDQATDTTTIIQLADLTVIVSHGGSFTEGGTGAYTLVARNVGTGLSSGTVTLTDTLPAGLSATALDGPGWTCNLAGLACTRSDALAGGSAYPAVTLMVNVASGTAGSVTNAAFVSGGGDVNAANNSTIDPTTILPYDPGPPPAFVTISAPVTETREASVTVSGRANGFATVHVGGAQTRADGSGNWSLVVPLVEGPNLITATNGIASANVTVTRDSTPPSLQLLASELTTEAESVTLFAVAEAGATVTIEGQAVTKLKVSLSLGSNTFTAAATDRLGNIATASVTVVRTAPPPPENAPVLDALPAEVEQSALSVTGQATAGVSVTLLVNGAAQGTATVDAAGRFTLPATLAEGANRLQVRSASGLTSAEVTVTYRRPIHFADLDGHWAAPAIYRMARAGVVEGFPDQTFRPEAPVTRLEFAVLVARASKLPPDAGTLPFTDADQIPSWAGPLLLTAYRADIIQGHDDGSFRPNDPVTRAEAAAMLYRAARLTGKVGAWAHITFADEDQIPAWALKSIQVAAHYRLVVGYPDGTFQPARTTTRAEAVTMLDRLTTLLAP